MTVEAHPTAVAAPGKQLPHVFEALLVAMRMPDVFRGSAHRSSSEQRQATAAGLLHGSQGGRMPNVFAAPHTGAAQKVQDSTAQAPQHALGHGQ